jgi:hypothetical protein
MPLCRRARSRRLSSSKPDAEHSGEELEQGDPACGPSAGATSAAIGSPRSVVRFPS